MKKLRINKPNLKTFVLPLLALSLVVGYTVLLGGRMGAISLPLIHDSAGTDTLANTLMPDTISGNGGTTIGRDDYPVANVWSLDTTCFSDIESIRLISEYSVDNLSAQGTGAAMAVGDPSSMAAWGTVTSYGGEVVMMPNWLSRGFSAHGGAILGSSPVNIDGVWASSTPPTSATAKVMLITPEGDNGIQYSATKPTADVTFSPTSACASTPLATDPDTSTTSPSTPVTINVLGNDSGTGLSVSKIDGQDIVIGQTITLTNGSGTVKLNTDGTITFTPASTFQGESSFSYSITDGTSTVDTGAVKVTVASATAADPVNTPNQDTPVATNRTSAKPMLANTGENLKAISLVAAVILSLGVYLKVKSGKRVQSYIKR